MTWLPICCILSKFYIKPQHLGDNVETTIVVSYRNSTSNHNGVNATMSGGSVVSYRNSTSNHNILINMCLYSRVVSYRNSTSNHNSAALLFEVLTLYLIEILHQTTTSGLRRLEPVGCILSKFYIKPQLRRQRPDFRCVVSYRNSTSNHNFGDALKVAGSVVSYRNSTSNHNHGHEQKLRTRVVSYRNSTSNHNVGPHID